MSAICGSACTSCGELFAGRRDVCPGCGCTNLVERTLSGKGDVYSYAVIHSPSSPEGTKAEEDRLYALVHLVEGPYATEELKDIDASAVFIGMPLEAVTKDGDVLEFRPRRNLVE